ncbi:MAG: hypothetical protein Q8M51_08705 [Polaromonas sp.]|uniref:hypothetical protein n=1 Tax=Polaromonas sp. TaxID=1869339 RepID=UPI00272FD462|nr:hypothetical protein [Polaromonas sp.]MDP1739549.1 hypothetical protein [Polaromonas sp.]MDP1953155.1 hypothetical protein [Polaromonas sp.]MDP3355925.1 hypothetical protein [Polaromonas sp.]MDP3752979.1 hypothetical protein [Polaromonas sp.]
MTRSSPPPRFVPTLTEVVRPAQTPAGEVASEAPERPAHDLLRLQEQMVHRVMQRVDLTLERLLRETVGRLVLEHTQALAPSLRDEIEMVVRQSVNQAFEQELASQLLDRP